MLSGRGVNRKPFPVMRAGGHHKPLTSSVPNHNNSNVETRELNKP